MSMNWEAVEAISAAAQTLVVIGTMVAAVIQLRKMNQYNMIQAYMSIVSQLQVPEIREARRFLMMEMANKKEFSCWQESEIVKCERVCAAYDTVGQLLRHDQGLACTDSPSRRYTSHTVAPAPHSACISCRPTFGRAHRYCSRQRS